MSSACRLAGGPVKSLKANEDHKGGVKFSTSYLIFKSKKGVSGCRQAYTSLASLGRYRYVYVDVDTPNEHLSEHRVVWQMTGPVYVHIHSVPILEVFTSCVLLIEIRNKLFGLRSTFGVHSSRRKLVLNTQRLVSRLHKRKLKSGGQHLRLFLDKQIDRHPVEVLLKGSKLNCSIVVVDLEDSVP